MPLIYQNKLRGLRRYLVSCKKLVCVCVCRFVCVVMIVSVLVCVRIFVRLKMLASFCKSAVYLCGFLCACLRVSLVVCVCICLGGSVGFHVYEHVKMWKLTDLLLWLFYTLCVCFFVCVLVFVCFPFFIHYFISFIRTCFRNSFHAQLRKLCLMRLDDSTESTTYENVLRLFKLYAEV